MKVRRDSHRKQSFCTWILPTLAAVATAVAVTSCSKHEPGAQPGVQPVNVNENDANQLAAQGKNREAAEKHVEIGEILASTPEGLIYADQQFDKALKLDPSNAKANLYKAETGILMTAQGFLPRVERLAVKDKDVQALERVRQEIESYNQPGSTEFAESLPAGENPFASYYDVQRWEREKLLPAVLASIDHLSKVDASTPIRLNFNPARMSFDPTRKTYTYDYNEYSSTCYNDPTTGWNCNQYNYVSNGTWSDPKLPNVYYLDVHDLKIFRASYTAIANAIRLGTAYSNKDVEYAIRRLRAIHAIRTEAGKLLSPEDVAGVLMEFPDLLTLESDNQLSQVAQSATEALKDGLELDSLRTELCDGKSRTAQNSLIHPICIAAADADAMRMGVDLLAGPKPVVLGTDPNGNDVQILIDVTQLLSNSPKDLKAFLPTAFDANGYPTTYPDPTMGGVFPNGDVIQKFGQLAGSTDLMYQGVSSTATSTVHQIKDRL